ncbi:thiamine pyrophosphate-dependent enzyme [Minwuia thermotolerans]|uniref:Aldehyde dehydrogenase n=1 Tax=Minwuia thermotolerans TaxID=2056226 RepID=A0A2M9FWK3_9PROT|nr:thiamine pyrophosphate-dependent enzyme [Minwuia thermotolerans]PJK27846.1 aldehyde dehydrogenase [Minwuia thermotolerans]
MNERANDYPIRRRELAAAIMADNPDALFIAGLGATAWDLTAAGDRPTTFPLWGAMGGAAAMGLGLALAQPERRVIVVTGDGEQLMGLGALATVAVQRPANLAIVVFDNESYGETGMQATHTAAGVDLAGVARAAGFPLVRTAATPEDARAALPDIRAGRGPVFAAFKVRAEVLPFALPPKDGAWLKDRFRRALLGPAAVGET